VTDIAVIVGLFPAEQKSAGTVYYGANLGGLNRECGAPLRATGEADKVATDARGSQRPIV